KPQEKAPDVIVAGKYRLLNRIGHGSFGELYRAVNLKYGDEVAVKLEKSAVRRPLLPNEARIYSLLEGAVGFPRVRYFGTEGVHNALVIDLLGPTLEDLFNFCSRSFTMKTTLMLADQILDRVEYIHEKQYLHRDIKPENLLMGLGRDHTQVFMIDFGLAKQYYSLRRGHHIRYVENQELVGTARYASIHAHFAEQSRRDDLESVGYLLLYFLRGQLPWQGIQAASIKQKFEKIAESKSSLPLGSLCTGLPLEFFLYLRHCRNLRFTERPDYGYLRYIFRVLFRKLGLSYDLVFDWMHWSRQSKTKG
ncbi:hypothetical protein KR018_003843, partial [Drosophila ironensis]